MKAAKRLSNSELGRHGEQLFPILAAGFAFHKVGDNRTGWDYLLEFPNEDIDRSAFLDQQFAPLPIRVQVKTMYDTRRAFQTPLRSAQRLALGEEGPSFFCVLKVDQTLRITKAYLIEVIDTALEKILWRLVEEGVVANVPRAKAKVSFTQEPRWKEFSPEGTGLKEAIIGILGDRIHPTTYRTAKAAQQQTLGYGQPHSKMHVTFEARTEDDIRFGLLGFKPLTVTDSQFFDLRFGIERLRSDISGSGTMFIEQTEPKAVRVIFRTGDGADADAISWEGVRSTLDPTIFPPSSWIARLHIPPLNIFLKHGTAFEVKTDDLHLHSATLSAWLKLASTLKAFASGTAMLEVLGKEAGTYVPQLGPIRMSPKTSNEPLLALANFLFRFVPHFVRLLKFMGHPDGKFTLRELGEASETVRTISRLLFENVTDLRLEFELDDPTTDLSTAGEQAFGYALPVRLGDAFLVLLLAIRGTAERDGTNTRLKASSIARKECRLFAPPQYESITKEFEEKWALHTMIKGPLSKADPLLPRPSSG